MNNPFDKQNPIPGVKNIIVVSSGKGGVGKSTVATNLALSLGKKYKVGLLDADIYGPSLPRLMGTLNQKPNINSEGKIEPISRYGLKLMSIGYLINEASAVVWRGPMLFKAIDQFLRDVQWSPLDILVIDLPPGTGDIQLSLAQKVPLSGAIIVSTPQNIAFMDAKKSIDMFERVNVPILGLIENMSYMLNPSTGDRIQMYPKGELEQFIQTKNIVKLGEIPFNPSISLSCEAGVPIVESHTNGIEAISFNQIAEKIASMLFAREPSASPTP
jgi:ATP-binding protein involved in chromosome partitioning